MALIDREALMAYPIRLDHYDKVHGNEDFVLGIESVLEYAEALPVADAVPVVHARWEYLGDNSTGQIMGCTRCSKSINPDKTAVALNRQTNYPDYCPNCGARMDGEQK